MDFFNRLVGSPSPNESAPAASELEDGYESASDLDQSSDSFARSAPPTQPKRSLEAEFQLASSSAPNSSTGSALRVPSNPAASVGFASSSSTIPPTPVNSRASALAKFKAMTAEDLATLVETLNWIDNNPEQLAVSPNTADSFRSAVAPTASQVPEDDDPVSDLSGAPLPTEPRRSARVQAASRLQPSSSARTSRIEPNTPFRAGPAADEVAAVPDYQLPFEILFPTYGSPAADRFRRDVSWSQAVHSYRVQPQGSTTPTEILTNQNWHSILVELANAAVRGQWSPGYLADRVIAVSPPIIKNAAMFLEHMANGYDLLSFVFIHGFGTVALPKDTPLLVCQTSEEDPKAFFSRIFLHWSGRLPVSYMLFFFAVGLSSPAAQAGFLKNFLPDGPASGTEATLTKFLGAINADGAENNPALRHLASRPSSSSHHRSDSGKSSNNSRSSNNRSQVYTRQSGSDQKPEREANSTAKVPPKSNLPSKPASSNAATSASSSRPKSSANANQRAPAGKAFAVSSESTSLLDADSA